MLIAFTLYLTAHLAFYILWLRHLAILRTEKGIFLYHFSSAVVTGLLVVVAAFIYPEEFGLAGCVLVLSVHGIYSLTFLELWSLAQGGYSLSIIAGIARAEASGEEPDFSALEAIGVAKQADRVTALERMGLVSRSGEHISFTSRGKSIAAVFHLLRRWVDPGEQQLRD
jgi:hypothetical protein